VISDRRTVGELTIEELEQILIVRRRQARAERMRRLQDIGRLPAESALPSEDWSPIGSGTAAAGAVSDKEGVARRRVSDIEPLRDKARHNKARRDRARRQGLRERPARSRGGRIRDKVLLVLEVGALLGLVGVLVVSLQNIRALNDDYAGASQQPIAAVVTPTIVAEDVLPGGHAPPEEPGSVPAHLRDLMEGQSLPAVAIPTPGPEAPTRIVIPAINIDALIVEGDTWEQLKLGVGHHLNTADPGERGNMVLSAHDDIYGEIFRRLGDLELGDEIVVYAGEQPYRYIVTAKQIVDPTDVSVLAPTTKPVATLISCYPYMVDTHRIVVVAELQ
jgi:sortase A